MRKALLPDTPEVKNWVREILHERGIHLYPVEGYSVKDEGVSALFERRISTVEVGKWSEDEVSGWLETKEDKNSWLARVVLAESLNVPLYLVLWQNGKENFRILSVTVNNAARIEVAHKESFNSCKDLAQWISKFKGMPVSKGFAERHRLSLIDKCLRLHGVPWPGNLDGFLLNKSMKRVKAIFEIRRTEKYAVENHDLNRFFYKDFKGWKALDILRKQLNVPLYIVTWSRSEKLVKLQKLRDVTKSALDYESTELLTDKQLIPRFGRIVG